MKNERVLPKPHPLTDPLLPVIQAQALISGVKTGIFEVIGPEGCSLNDLVGECKLNNQGLEKLLTLLCCMGYLEHTGDNYNLTEVSRQTLLPGSPFCLTGWIQFCPLQHEVVSALENVLQSGRPFDMGQLLSTLENRRIHQRGMADTARPAASRVAQQIPVKEGAMRILDIGGSHGLYSAALCRKYPGMSGDVLELPDTLEEAKEAAAREGTADVVNHIEGNVLTDELQGPYDVVFLGNLVHHFSPEQIRAVFQKISAALSRDGTIAIWDVLESGAEADIVGASFSLFFFLTSGTACYSPGELTGWLSEAGFSNIRIHREPGGATHELITGRNSSS